MDFVITLPRRLKVELTVIIHHNTMKKIRYFQEKEKDFIAFVGPMLDPYVFKEEQFIYREGDEIESIFFISKGVAGFVLTEFDDRIYATVEKGDTFGNLDLYDGLRCGKEINHTLPRLFSVMTLSAHCELFGLEIFEIEEIKKEYPEYFDDLFF